MKNTFSWCFRHCDIRGLSRLQWVLKLIVVFDMDDRFDWDLARSFFFPEEESEEDVRSPAKNPKCAGNGTPREMESDIVS